LLQQRQQNWYEAQARGRQEADDRSRRDEVAAAQRRAAQRQAENDATTIISLRQTVATANEKIKKLSSSQWVLETKVAQLSSALQEKLDDHQACQAKLEIATASMMQLKKQHLSEMSEANTNNAKLKAKVAQLSSALKKESDNHQDCQTQLRHAEASMMQRREKHQSEMSEANTNNSKLKAEVAQLSSAFKEQSDNCQACQAKVKLETTSMMQLREKNLSEMSEANINAKLKAEVAQLSSVLKKERDGNLICQMEQERLTTAITKEHMSQIVKLKAKVEATAKECEIRQVNEALQQEQQQQQQQQQQQLQQQTRKELVRQLEPYLAACRDGCCIERQLGNVMDAMKMEVVSGVEEAEALAKLGEDIAASQSTVLHCSQNLLAHLADVAALAQDSAWSTIRNKAWKALTLAEKETTNLMQQQHDIQVRRAQRKKRLASVEFQSKFQKRKIGETDDKAKNLQQQTPEKPLYRHPPSSGIVARNLFPPHNGQEHYTSGSDPSGDRAETASDRVARQLAAAALVAQGNSLVAKARSILQPLRTASHGALQTLIRYLIDEQNSEQQLAPELDIVLVDAQRLVALCRASLSGETPELDAQTSFMQLQKAMGDLSRLEAVEAMRQRAQESAGHLAMQRATLESLRDKLTDTEGSLKNARRRGNNQVRTDDPPPQTHTFIRCCYAQDSTTAAPMVMPDQFTPLIYTGDIRRYRRSLHWRPRWLASVRLSRSRKM